MANIPTLPMSGQALKDALDAINSEIGDVNGIPAGGTDGQILAKQSGDDYDVTWINAPSGSGGGFSGDYDDLTNKPTLGSAAASDASDFATAAQGATADSAVQPSDLISDDANNTLSGQVKFWAGSQADYDALGSYDPNTIYDVVS